MVVIAPPPECAADEGSMALEVDVLPLQPEKLPRRSPVGKAGNHVAS
jgi:hypothetical protein